MFDIKQLIESGGLLIISAIVFAESGLLIGFFLPGDTLLFGAGLYASQGHFSLPLLILCVVIAAVIGDNVGYSIGRRSGRRLFNKKDSLLFRSEYIDRAEEFYEKHGGKTIILARFVPVIRTFAPVVAGISKMPRQRFMIFNVVGAVVWGVTMPSLGYYIGNRIPHLDKYIELVMFGILVLSLALALIHLFKKKESRQLLAEKVKYGLRNIFLNKKID
ncbi:MAG: VTT domain-containing protein [Patescibacteria group bacterium]